MAKRSKNIKHKCIHLNDMRLEIAEAAKAKYLWHEEHVSSSPAPVLIIPLLPPRLIPLLLPHQ
jgi:hypothetical protein